MQRILFVENGVIVLVKNGENPVRLAHKHGTIEGRSDILGSNHKAGVAIIRQDGDTSAYIAEIDEDVFVAFDESRFDDVHRIVTEAAKNLDLTLVVGV